MNPLPRGILTSNDNSLVAKVAKTFGGCSRSRMPKLLASFATYGFCLLTCCSIAAALPLETDNASNAEIKVADDLTDDQVNAEPAEKVANSDFKRALLLPIPLPLQDRDVNAIRSRLQSISDESLSQVDAGGRQSRPIVVLQFVSKGFNPKDVVNAWDVAAPIAGKETAIGKGTEYERALALARFLISPTGVRLKTIALISNSIEGHAVLVALACEEIAMAPMAEIKRAGVDDASNDPTIVASYETIAARRGLVPVAAAKALLSTEAQLYQVETIDNRIRFVDETALKTLSQNGEVRSETQISIPNQMAVFSGQEMRSWQWSQYLLPDSKQLASILKVDRIDSVPQFVFDGPRVPALVEINGLTQSTNVNRWIRTIDEAIEKDKANLLFIHFQSAGGSLEDSIRFAQHIAGLDPTRVETVFFVDREARGDSAIIAMSGNQLWVSENAIVGGPGDLFISAKDVVDQSQNWSNLENNSGRDDCEFFALVSPDLPLFQYTKPDGRSTISNPEIVQLRVDAARWQQNGKVSLPEGMRGKAVVEQGWANATADRIETVAAKWEIDRLPPAKRASGLQQWVENVANTPFLAVFLLALGFSALSKEMATPGLGLGGFVALLSFSLFFWLKFLDGTVEWLEITLVVGGLIAIGVEFFVLPGFGIFGFGGFIMLTAGLVLSSQTFIFPSNEYQWEVTASGTTQVAIACMTVLAVLYVIRDHIQQLPFVKWFALKPPAADSTAVEEEGLEFLVGQIGRTTTRCAPIGRAIIEDQYWNVHSESELLESDTPIQVVRVEQSTIVVERSSE